MEFVLVPLLALAAVTAAINKLAGLLFHIHLSCRLLILLIGFAWLISLVLPELFFHSAGFLGSIGLSLVGALGFACLAALYDARTNASVILPVPAETQPAAPATVLAAQEPDASAMGAIEPSTGNALTPESFFMAADPVQAIEFESSEQVKPVPAPEPTFAAILASAAGQAEMAETAFTADLPNEVRAETMPLTGEPTGPPPAVGSEPVFTMEPEPEMAGEQPVSDSLSDLLEFAFDQRDRHHAEAALSTFRLIKHLYAESAAVPMVVAEIVSTLQSRGDYGEAATELRELLQLPAIRQNEQQVRAFEQKLNELQDLQAAPPEGV